MRLVSKEAMKAVQLLLTKVENMSGVGASLFSDSFTMTLMV